MKSHLPELAEWPLLAIGPVNRKISRHRSRGILKQFAGDIFPNDYGSPAAFRFERLEDTRR
jgi:hypothetical protein